MEQILLQVAEKCGPETWHRPLSKAETSNYCKRMALRLRTMARHITQAKVKQTEWARRLLDLGDNGEGCPDDDEPEGDEEEKEKDDNENQEEGDESEQDVGDDEGSDDGAMPVGLTGAADAPQAAYFYGYDPNLKKAWRESSTGGRKQYSELEVLEGSTDMDFPVAKFSGENVVIKQISVGELKAQATKGLTVRGAYWEGTTADDDRVWVSRLCFNMLLSRQSLRPCKPRTTSRPHPRPPPPPPHPLFLRREPLLPIPYDLQHVRRLAGLARPPFGRSGHEMYMGQTWFVFRRGPWEAIQSMIAHLIRKADRAELVCINMCCANEQKPRQICMVRSKVFAEIPDCNPLEVAKLVMIQIATEFTQGQLSIDKLFPRRDELVAGKLGTSAWVTRAAQSAGSSTKGEGTTTPPPSGGVTKMKAMKVMKTMKAMKAMKGGEVIPMKRKVPNTEEPPPKDAKKTVSGKLAQAKVRLATRRVITSAQC
jgi:hypothetical protein